MRHRRIVPSAVASATFGREECTVVEVNEMVVALYEAATRSGCRWDRPRHEAEEGCYRFFSSVSPLDWQLQEPIEVQLHVHPGGEESSLSFAIPLYVEPHWNGFTIAAKAQNRLAEADDDEGYAGEVSVQYRVNDEGIPELEGVWAELSWEVGDWVSGERPLQFDWAFEDLERRLQALGDLVGNSVRD